MTDIAGSSLWFDCGMVAYSYEAKQALLGVQPQTLETHGAVSRETAIEMVSGALVHSGATLAVAVTGIAGPGGGSCTACPCAGVLLLPFCAAPAAPRRAANAAMRPRSASVDGASPGAPF